MQALKPFKTKTYESKNAPYGSVFHWHEDNTVYRPEHLKTWTDKEILLKHYHLTARLDGYNHLDGDTTIMQQSVMVFREVLRLRGIDGVRHCIKMDWLYNAGYRSVVIFYPKIKDEPEVLPISYVKVSL